MGRPHFFFVTYFASEQNQVPSGLFPEQRGPTAKENAADNNKKLMAGRRGSWTLAFWIYLVDSADGR